MERERLTPKAVTLPEVLKNAGYKTGIFGKWHLGDEDAYQPQKRGFDEVFIHGGGGIGQTFPGSCGDAPANEYFSPVIRHNGVFEKTDGFCTDTFTSQAQRWMESLPKDQPFFCYIPFNAAHAPYSCPDADKSPFKDKVPDKTATFLGMIANIDANVGRILNSLDASGRASNTLVVFMNDNGCDPLGAKVFNAGMRGTKGTPWIGGTRAVSFWRLPHSFPPRDCDSLAAHIDVFPTLTALAGVAPTTETIAQVEGRSLIPLLENTSTEWPQRTLITHLGRWPKGSDFNAYKFSNCSLRRGPWHLVWSQAGPNAPESSAQLFDVLKDPSESEDVAATNPTLVRELKQAYDQWWNNVTPFFINESVIGPKINPFKEAFWKQFGGGPTDADLKKMDPTVKGKF